MTSILDRVMVAYNSKHKLTPAMDARIRTQLSPFIARMMSGDPHGCDAAPIQPLAKPVTDGRAK